jgi:hypothetical protein
MEEVAPRQSTRCCGLGIVPHPHRLSIPTSKARASMVCSTRAFLTSYDWVVGLFISTLHGVGSGLRIYKGQNTIASNGTGGPGIMHISDPWTKEACPPPPTPPFMTPRLLLSAQGSAWVRTHVYISISSTVRFTMRVSNCST